MKERTIWIDYLKVIGIWLVVLGHRDLLDTDYTQLIYCFHMPLFFVSSGYLAGDSSFRQSVMKETNRLLMPFIATSTIQILKGTESLVAVDSNPSEGQFSFSIDSCIGCTASKADSNKVGIVSITDNYFL